jgi:predicted permease
VFVTSLIGVALLIALAMPGYILRKLKMLPGEIVNGLATIMLYVTCPFLTISSFAKIEYYDGLLFNMVLTFILAFVLLPGAFFIGKLCFMRAKENAEKRVCVAGSYMNNGIFMGVPVLQIFFPGDPEPIVYAMMFAAVFNILSWTLLVYTITGDKKYINLKSALLNPGTVSLVVALPLLMFNIHLPEGVITMANFLANMTTPLSMIIMGIRLAEIRLLDLFTTFKVYVTTFIKLIVAPLFAFGVIAVLRLLVPVDHTLARTLYIVMAMPSAAYVIVFSEKFNGDRVTAVKCVLLSSLLSIVTIPLMMLLSPLL